MAEKKPIDAGIIARAIGGMREWTQAWFGPGQPMEVMVHGAEDVASTTGRQFDYMVGINRNITPRGNEAVSFTQLRALADSCDVLRLVIETRKDQMAKLGWTVKPRNPDVEPDDRCAQLQAVFQFPDREHDWDTWLRMLLEELFVIDAPAIYIRKTRGGGVYALEPMDGSTLKRVIDEHGRTPQAPDPAYQQVLKGAVAAQYSTDELVYRPRNQRVWKMYGYSPVEQIILTINTAIRRSVHVMQFYTEGNVPEAIAGVPETWNPDQIKMFQDYWDSLMEGNTAQRRHMKFIPGKVDLSFTKDAVLKDEFDEWLARMVCFAFSISPAPFVKQMNRATAETAHEAALAEGLMPIMQWVTNLMNFIISEHYKMPDLMFAWTDEKALDPVAKAEVDKIYLDAGVILPDEVRAELGKEPLTPEQIAEISAARQPPPMAIQPGLEVPPGAAPPPALPAPVAKLDQGTEVAKAKKAKPGRIDPDRAEMKKQEAKLAKTMHAFFTKQASKVLSGIEKADEPDAVTGADGKKINRAVLSVNWDELVDDVQPVLTETAMMGGAAGLAAVGMDDDTTIYGPRVTQWAADRAAEMVGKKWVDGELVDNPNAEWVISDSTRKMTQDAVTRAVDEGQTMDELASSLEDAFGESRAMMIARTETRLADSNASMISYRESGVVAGTEWITSNDDLVSEECQANADAGVVPLGDLYPSGDEAPPGHPACRCSCSPVLSDE